MLTSVMLIAALTTMLLGTSALLAQDTSAVREDGANENSEPDNSDGRLIKQVFTDYKSALMAGDGVAAAALVDSETLLYFGALKELAASGDEATLRARPFVDRLLIISMRQILSADELRSLELGELMNRAVADGWISPQTVAQLDIGAVEVEGNDATAEARSMNPALSLEASEDDDGLRYRFTRESGEWKFGFSSLVGSLNRMIEDFTAQLGTNQDELIFVLVQSLTGKPVLPEVWELPSGQVQTPP